MFDERFIDREIGELCMEYDKIKGANTNIQRISPSLIDGLKPVQRRALFVMFDKDGGRTFHKLATISGDVFGKVHPHSPVAIEDAIVNIAQSWHNNIPLIEGQGNFGCHDSKTEVLTKDGWKYFKDLTMDDELATIAPNCDSNNEITYEKPIRLFAYDHMSSLVTSKDSKLTFNVTPNHRMLISDDGNEFYFAKMLLVRNLDKGYMMSIVNNKPEIVEVHPKKDFINNYYHGRIYCAEVPTYHTLITRYNGTIMVSGNSIAGDPAGASRYIKARLSDYAYACFFEDWKDSVVDTTLAYDEETKMPDYLPAKYPNVLLNGCLGIG